MSVSVKGLQTREECNNAIGKLSVLSEAAIGAGFSPARCSALVDSAVVVAKKVLSDAQKNDQELGDAIKVVADVTSRLECIQQNGQYLQDLASYQVNTWLVGLNDDQRQQFMASDLGKRAVQLLCQSYMDLPARKVQDLVNIAKEPALRALVRPSSLVSRIAESVKTLVATDSSKSKPTTDSSDNKTANGPGTSSEAEKAGLVPTTGDESGSVKKPDVPSDASRRLPRTGSIDGVNGSKAGSSSTRGRSAISLSAADANRIETALIDILGNDLALQFSTLKRLCDDESGRLSAEPTVGQGAVALEGQQAVLGLVTQKHRALFSQIDPDRKGLPHQLSLVNGIENLFFHLANSHLFELSADQAGSIDQTKAEASRTSLKSILETCDKAVLGGRIEAVKYAIHVGSQAISSPLKEELSDIFTQVERSYKEELSRPGFVAAKADESLAEALKTEVFNNNASIKEHIDKVRQYCIDQGLSDSQQLEGVIDKSVVYLLRDCVIQNSATSTKQNKADARNELLASILLNLHAPNNLQHSPNSAVRYLPLALQVGSLIANKVLDESQGGVLGGRRPDSTVIRSALGVSDTPKASPAINPAQSILPLVKPGNIWGLITGQRFRANMVSSAIGGWLQSFVRKLNPESALDYQTATKAATAGLKLAEGPGVNTVQATFSDTRQQKILNSEMELLIHQLVVGAPSQEISNQNEANLNGVLRAQLTNMGVNLNTYDKAVKAAEERSKKSYPLSVLKSGNIRGMYYNDSEDPRSLKVSSDQKILNHNGDSNNRLSKAIESPDQIARHRNRTVLMSLAFRTAMWNTLTKNGDEVKDQITVKGDNTIESHGVMDRLGLNSNELTNQQLIRMSKLVLSVVSPEAFRSSSLSGLKQENNSQDASTKRANLLKGLIGGVSGPSGGETLAQGNLGTQLLDRLVNIGKKRGPDLCDKTDQEVINMLLGLMLAKSRVDYHGARPRATGAAGATPAPAAEPPQPGEGESGTGTLEFASQNHDDWLLVEIAGLSAQASSLRKQVDDANKAPSEENLDTRKHAAELIASAAGYEARVEELERQLSPQGRANLQTRRHTNP